VADQPIQHADYERVWCCRLIPSGDGKMTNCPQPAVCKSPDFSDEYPLAYCVGHAIEQAELEADTRTWRSADELR
jgi:hypothetical protein